MGKDIDSLSGINSESIGRLTEKEQIKRQPEGEHDESFRSMVQPRQDSRGKQSDYDGDDAAASSLKKGGRSPLAIRQEKQEEIAQSRTESGQAQRDLGGVKKSSDKTSTPSSSTFTAPSSEKQQEKASAQGLKVEHASTNLSGHKEPAPKGSLELFSDDVELEHSGKLDREAFSSSDRGSSSRSAFVASEGQASLKEGATLRTSFASQKTAGSQSPSVSPTVPSNMPSGVGRTPEQVTAHAPDKASLPPPSLTANEHMTKNLSPSVGPREGNSSATSSAAANPSIHLASKDSSNEVSKQISPEASRHAPQAPKAPKGQVQAGETIAASKGDSALASSQTTSQTTNTPVATAKPPVAPTVAPPVATPGSTPQTSPQLKANAQELQAPPSQGGISQGKEAGQKVAQPPQSSGVVKGHVASQAAPAASETVTAHKAHKAGKAPVNQAASPTQPRTPAAPTPPSPNAITTEAALSARPQATQAARGTLGPIIDAPKAAKTPENQASLPTSPQTPVKTPTDQTALPPSAQKAQAAPHTSPKAAQPPQIAPSLAARAQGVEKNSGPQITLATSTQNTSQGAKVEVPPAQTMSTTQQAQPPIKGLDQQAAPKAGAQASTTKAPLTTTEPRGEALTHAAPKAAQTSPAAAPLATRAQGAEKSSEPQTTLATSTQNTSQGTKVGAQASTTQAPLTTNAPKGEVLTQAAPKAAQTSPTAAPLATRAQGAEKSSEPQTTLATSTQNTSQGTKVGAQASTTQAPLTTSGPKGESANQTAPQTGQPSQTALPNTKQQTRNVPLQGKVETAPGSQTAQGASLRGEAAPKQAQANSIGNTAAKTPPSTPLPTMQGPNAGQSTNGLPTTAPHQASTSQTALPPSEASRSEREAPLSKEIPNSASTSRQDRPETPKALSQAANDPNTTRAAKQPALAPTTQKNSDLETTRLGQAGEVLPKSGVDAKQGMRDASSHSSKQNNQDDATPQGEKTTRAPEGEIGVKEEETLEEAKVNLAAATTTAAQGIAAPSNAVPTSRATEIQELISQLVSELSTLTTKERTDTMVTLSKPPAFKGAQIVISEFKSAKGEFNISFNNLGDQAMKLLAQHANSEALRQGLEQKGFTMHIFQYSEQAAQQTFTQMSQGDNFGRGSGGQEGSGRGDGEGGSQGGSDRGSQGDSQSDSQGDQQRNREWQELQ